MASWFRVTLALCALAITAAYCNRSINSMPWSAPAPVAANDESWIGVYTAPSEIAGFSGTYLWLKKSTYGIEYSENFYSDVPPPRSPIDHFHKAGEVLIDGEKLYVPEGYAGLISPNPHDKVPMHYSVTRYTRVHINGRAVLMRDDAFEAFQKSDTLYDYGILIKTSDDPDSEAKRESIKVLYRNPAKEWKDPFVHGPNER